MTKDITLLNRIQTHQETVALCQNIRDTLYGVYQIVAKYHNVTTISQREELPLNRKYFTKLKTFLF